MISFKSNLNYKLLLYASFVHVLIVKYFQKIIIVTLDKVYL